jgi:photosystem II stability/assembly factor-like uncharacterized protein
MERVDPNGILLGGYAWIRTTYLPPYGTYLASANAADHVMLAREIAVNPDIPEYIGAFTTLRSVLVRGKDPGGTNWQRAATFPDYHFGRPHVFADGTLIAPVSNRGRGAILRVNSDGTTSTTPTTRPMTAVAFDGPNGVALGWSDRVFVTADGGAHWKDYPIDDGNVGGAVMIGKDAFAIRGSELLHSDDGGVTWASAF